MKASNYTSQNLSPDLCAGLLTVTEELTDSYDPQLPNGWRSLIRINEIDSAKNRHSILTINTESAIGGGEYADTKLAMLEKFRELSYTGEEDASKLAYLLKETYGSDPTIQTVCDQLYDAGKTIRVDPEVWEILRKKHYSVTHWYGGIRIPALRRAISHTPNTIIKEARYEIIIAFSGAKQWMDVFFALSIFKELQELISASWADSTIRYDLSALESDPQIEFFLHNLGIQKIWTRPLFLAVRQEGTL